MAISLLAQKIGKVTSNLDIQIMKALGRLAPHCIESDFRRIVRIQKTFAIGPVPNLRSHLIEVCY